MRNSIKNTLPLFCFLAFLFLPVIFSACDTVSGGSGGYSSGSSSGNGVPITIKLPPIGNFAIRALTGDQVSRLQRDTKKYRVTFSGAGQTITREGEDTTFSAIFPVGTQVGVTVYCLNEDGEVIVETVTKTITVFAGSNSLSFKLSEDGTESQIGNVKYVGGASDAKGVPTDTVAHSPGSDVPLSAQEPTRTGFRLMGWISDVDLIGTDDSGSQTINQGIPFAKVGTSAPGIDFKINTFKMPNSQVTLTAKWDINYKYDKADWEVGDIVLVDGQSTMAIHPNAVTEATVAYPSGKQITVVYKNDAATKKVYIVGKEHAQKAWCLDSANGYSLKIDTLYCIPDDDSSSGDYKWTQGQDTDGSGNWQKLKVGLAQNDDTDTSGNYPTWEYCNSYGTTLALEGELANGWYLPTFAEIFFIWKVRESMSVCLKALGIRFLYRYWTSSQDATEPTYAWFLDFTAGGNYEVNRKTYNTTKSRVANNANFCVAAVHQLY